MPIMLEKSRENTLEYDAVFVEPKHLAALNNPIAVSIVRELALQPGCAMDLARKLNQHEQKIYYHLNKLARGAIVKIVGTERRYGMVAQMFGLTSPVVAAKLHEQGGRVVSNGKSNKDYDLLKFLTPFVVDGKMNCHIVVGDPYPHGEFDVGGLDGVYAADVAMLLGNVVQNMNFPSYKIDIRLSDKDLLDNMILIGSIKTNSVLNRINAKLPMRFDKDSNHAIVSDYSDKKYDDDLVGMILKCKNPMDPSKQIVVLGGRRTRGTLAAVIAFTQRYRELMEREKDGVLAVVVKGIDKDGDGQIDDVKIVE